MITELCCTTEFRCSYSAFFFRAAIKFRDHRPVDGSGHYQQSRDFIPVEITTPFSSSARTTDESPPVMPHLRADPSHLPGPTADLGRPSRLFRTARTTERGPGRSETSRTFTGTDATNPPSRTVTHPLRTPGAEPDGSIPRGRAVLLPRCRNPDPGCYRTSTASRTKAR
jgi:hypothetical protein